jgi:3',5'-cyclic AMP phosphodiesterase CpdA
VQISDTHIEEPGQRAYGRYDTADSLVRCLAAILALDRRPDLESFRFRWKRIRRDGSSRRTRAV